ncbi:MAG: ribbon-helix-helix domain-containing protein [Candidatus Hydrogenedentes bacterium]|nr:ribbon-helix-helix domain-containing protein [Candidatus Hydrogenedentota bacterium]
MAHFVEQQVITFKVDKALWNALEGIPNRSEFIRNAILHALSNVCPICSGTGVLNPEQKKHIEEFLKTHEIVICSKCNYRHLSCSQTEKRSDACTTTP